MLVRVRAGDAAVRGCAAQAAAGPILAAKTYGKGLAMQVGLWEAGM